MATLTLPQEDVRFPQAQGYDARIDDLYVRAAPGDGIDLSIYTQDSLAERRDDEGSFYENVLSIGYAWDRTDWSGGEGLDWDPTDRALSDAERDLFRIRYWDSSFLDVSAGDPGIPYTLDLTKKFGIWAGTATAPVDITASESLLFVASGVDVDWYPDWTTFTPDDSDTLPSAVVALAAAPNGVCMAVLTSGDISVRPNGAAAFVDGLYTVAGNRKALACWYAKGRFIVAFHDTDDDIYELSEVTSTDAWAANLTEAIIDTADAAFWSVVDSGPAVVAACGDGTVRTYTPFLDSSDPALVGQLISRGRTTMPTGEIPYLLGDIEDLLIILTLATDPDDATTNRVHAYSAEVLDARFDYGVGNRQHKRVWNGTGTIASVTHSMVSRRDELFFTVHEDDATAEVWRFDAVTAGLSRHSQVGTDKATALLSFLNTLGGVTDGNDVFVDGVTFNDIGVLITPNITFGLNTPINWVAVVIEARQLGNGATIELYRSTDPSAITDENHASWVLMRRLSSNAQSGIETAMQNITSRTLAMMLKVTPTSDNLITAQVTRLAVRGLPQHRDMLVDLPVNISDLIEVPGRQPVRVPGWGNVIHNALLDKRGDHVELELYNPPLVFRGIVSNIVEPTSWISPRGSAGQRCIVQFRGQRVTEGGSQSAITGDSLTGLGLMGISTTGIGNAGPS